MKAAWRSFALWATMLLCAPAIAWYELDEKQSFTGQNNKPVHVTVLTIDPRLSRLRLASTRNELGLPSVIGDYSIREFSKRLANNSKTRGSDWVIVNGGFSSYKLDVPLGLLIINGTVYSTLSKEKGRSTLVRSGSDFARYRWSGVLCERPGGSSWEIVATAEYKEGNCKNALQAGPMLVEPGGVVGVSESEPERSNSYIRTAICLSRDGKIRIILTKDPTVLLPLAKWMAGKRGKSGLGCDTALNLSGDDSAAIATKAVNQRNPTVLGEGSFPLPTVLIFEPKAR